MECVLVIGAAKSGIAAAKLLHRHGYDVTLTDMKEVAQKAELKAMGIAVYDGGHPDTLKEKTYAFVVKNPGIPYHAPFVKYFVDLKTPIYTEIEIAYRYGKNFHYGAITGTNGKTTITTLLYEMLKKRGKAEAAGNIGTPLSVLAYEQELEELYIALELSNFQLLGIEQFAPEVSVVCNLAPDHLDYMGSLDAYYASKMRIYENCTPNQYFLRNVDDEMVLKYAQNIPCQVIDFSLLRDDVDLFVKDGKVYYHDVMLFDRKNLKLAGDYNLCNAMISACMAYCMGVSLEDIQSVIDTFKGVEHRLEYLGEQDGVRFYNDSKATNTHAASAALSSFEQGIVLLAGGYDKGISFDDLKQYDERVKTCIAFGQTKEMFKDIFTSVTLKETMKEAFDEALKVANAGDVILLSPACASYDQFKSYEERGHIFKQYVANYLKGEIA